MADKPKIVTVQLLKRVAGYNLNVGELAGFSEHTAQHLIKIGAAKWPDPPEGSSISSEEPGEKEEEPKSKAGKGSRK